MSLKEFISKIYFKRMLKKIENFQKDPVGEQETIFRYLMKQASKTQFGKDHGLTPNTSYEDFKKLVEIKKYDDFIPYIDKVLEGEKNVLYPGKPLYLATTSGTTSGEKYIPVTKDSLKRGMASSVLCSATYLEETQNYPSLFKKMVILSANPALENINGVLTGKITGIFNRHIPSFMKKQRIPSVETNSMDDWDEKMERTIYEALGQDVGMVGGFPGWIIRFFERTLQVTGKKTIKEVFPNLKIITHGGVAYGPYKERMETLIGEQFDRLEVFSASEGFMAFQDRQQTEDMLLVPNSEIFFEFVPLDQWGTPDAERLSLKDVKVGIPYALVISTMAGLWAYDLGDTITFTSLNPYRLKVSGRTKHFISNSGEHLISEQVEWALTETAKTFGVEIIDFSVAPLITNTENGNRHEWLIEFQNHPEDLQAFSQSLADNLCIKSDNYKILRESSILHDPVVTPLKRGAFVNYMKSIGKMTHQNKVPRLMNSRNLADAVKAYEEVNHDQ